MGISRAVVLAAGVGSRLKWLTKSHPKAMMAINDDTAIEHVIRRLAAQGIPDIAVNVHHHAETLMQFLGDGSRFGVRLYYSCEEILLDSGGGVRKAMELLPGDGLIAVHNADVIEDIDIQMLAANVPESGAVLAMVENPAHHPDGDFALEAGLITNAGDEKFTYSGVSVWDERSLYAYKADTVFPLTSPMRELMRQGKLSAVLHRGMWFDIGRPRDLMQARLYFSHK